jgi:hypothetical protein
MININKYADFFHDGSIMDIQHMGNKVEFSMASAEMDEEDVKDDVILSKDNSIQGKLHIEGIKSITIDKQPFFGEITKKYDNGKIFDFEITDNSVELAINWINFPPKPMVNEFSVIKIEAKKIWWENIPNLEASY